MQVGGLLGRYSGGSSGLTHNAVSTVAHIILSRAPLHIVESAHAMNMPCLQTCPAKFPGWY